MPSCSMFNKLLLINVSSEQAGNVHYELLQQTKQKSLTVWCIIYNKLQSTHVVSKDSLRIKENVNIKSVRYSFNPVCHAILDIGSQIWLE